MSAIEAGKRYAAIVWQKVVVFFLVAAAFNIFLHWDDFDALAGSLAGLAFLLGLICAGGFAYGFVMKAAPAVTSAETPVPATKHPEQQPAEASENSDSDEPPLWVWLMAGVLLWFWKSDFSVAAMPGTAKEFLLSAYMGMNKLLGIS